MNVTVFGGGGFIGSAIVDRLLLREHSVRVFERPRIMSHRSFSPNEKVSWINGDMLNKTDLDSAVERADVVYHLVSSTLPKSANDDPLYDVQSNLIGTLQLLQACVRAGVKKLVFISSGGTVYGTPIYLPIDERHPTDPHGSYGIIKLAIEKYLYMFERDYGLKSFALRVANPYGERQRIETAQGAVAVFLNRILKGTPIEVWGDGSVTRDFLYVGDVAEAFVKVMEYEGAFRTFNISSGVGISVNQLISEISGVVGVRPEVVYKPARGFDVPINVLSNLLAGQQLEWVPLVDLNSGLRRTIDWVRGVAI